MDGLHSRFITYLIAIINSKCPYFIYRSRWFNKDEITVKNNKVNSFKTIIPKSLTSNELTEVILEW